MLGGKCYYYWCPLIPEALLLTSILYLPWFNEFKVRQVYYLGNHPTPLWSCFSLYFNCFQGFWTFLVDGCCADRPTDKVLLLKSYLFWKSPSICCLRRSRENREVKRKKEKRGGRCEVEKEEKCIYCKHNFYQHLQSCFAKPKNKLKVMEKAGFSKVDQRRYDLPLQSSDNWIFKVDTCTGINIQSSKDHINIQPFAF